MPIAISCLCLTTPHRKVAAGSGGLACVEQEEEGGWGRMRGRLDFGSCFQSMAQRTGLIFNNIVRGTDSFDSPATEEDKFYRIRYIQKGSAAASKLGYRCFNSCMRVLQSGSFSLALASSAFPTSRSYDLHLFPMGCDHTRLRGPGWLRRPERGQSRFTQIICAAPNAEPGCVQEKFLGFKNCHKTWLWLSAGKIGPVDPGH